MRIGILTGPTATGKTAIALEFATAHPEIELINADSMLVYRGMDIGTAKPSPEERTRVRHHLIDVREPDEPFTAGDFHRAARATIDDIQARGRRPLFVGGTGFYLKALLYGLWEAPPAPPGLRRELEQLDSATLLEELRARDPASAGRIGPNDRYRLLRAVELLRSSGKTPTELQRQTPAAPDPRFELWIVDRPNAALHARIHQRTSQMLEQGLIEEVRSLRARFPETRALAAVGYAQVCRHLDGAPVPGRQVPAGIAGLASEIELATRQLVKRQRTWFRGQKLGQGFELDRQTGALLELMSRTYFG
ncbi:MAG: tRNA (adenosine(37)-N6)-dimethylallyltransferase MiaA [Oligoflexia bacterium]|nr:tRNA (adenosine(37)-N6)-dimethylallyltransferase MiaA [Oligoflexia bacterium]